MLYRRSIPISNSQGSNQYYASTTFNDKKTGIFLPLLSNLYDDNLNDFTPDFYNLVNLLYKYRDLPAVISIKYDGNNAQHFEEISKRIRGTGAILLGYVDYTDNNKQQVLDTWYQEYKEFIDGLYIDNIDTNNFNVNEFSQYKSQFNVLFGSIDENIVNNIPTNPEIYEIFNTFIPVKSNGNNIDIEVFKDTLKDFPYYKKAFIQYNTPELDITYLREIQDYVAVLYISDKDNSYTQLPTYLEQVLIILDNQPEILTFSPDKKVSINKSHIPQSTLEVYGSLAIISKLITDNYELTDKDNILYIDTSNKNEDEELIINLPQEKRDNRIYFIKKISDDLIPVIIKDNEDELIRFTEKNRTILIHYDTENNNWRILIDSNNQSNSGSQTGVKVDKITIDFNRYGELYLMDNSVNAQKIAYNVDVSNKGFIADKVDGYDVDDNEKKNSLWTGKRITKEAIIKAIIFG